MGSGGAGSGGMNGYPFPKVAPVRRSHSPLSHAAVDDDSGNTDTSANAKEFYDVDEDRCSSIPMRDGSSVGAEGVGGNGHRVGEGHVYVESVGFVRSGGGFDSEVGKFSFLHRERGFVG